MDDLQQYYENVITNPVLNVSCTFNVPKRYCNLQFLSYGGQGTVVTAQDLYQRSEDGSFRTVVIKKLQQPFCHIEIARRSYREFVLLKTFHHRNIILLLNAFTPNESLEKFNELYLVMEYAEMCLVNTIYAQPRTILPHSVISSAIYQILSAIKHLHDSGIIHRDLKPANTVVNILGVVKLLDFGLARQINQAPRTQYVVTRNYRAPEVILTAAYDEKLDVWSIGCIMAEMILGKMLFPAMHGSSADLQSWATIITVLGTPEESFIAKLPVYVARYVRSQPVYPRRCMEELFPDSNFVDNTTNPHFSAANARDLLSKMLKIDPSERCSVVEALQHPYLRHFYREEHVNIPPTVYNYHPEIDNVERTLEELKGWLFQEVKNYEQLHNIFLDVELGFL